MSRTPLESELLDPLARWFRDEYGLRRRMLIHEEPRGRGGRPPDMLIVLSERGREISVVWRNPHSDQPLPDSILAALEGYPDRILALPSAAPSAS